MSEKNFASYGDMETLVTEIVDKCGPAKNSAFDPTGTDLESTNAEDAIKELESNFQDGVDAIRQWTTAEVKSVSGNPITLTDGSARKAEGLAVTCNPKQNLHGYDHPWAGGAGKNKLGLIFTEESSAVAGLAFTHTESSFTLKGTSNSDGYRIMPLNYLPNIKSNTTYCLTVIVDKGSFNGLYISIAFRKDGAQVKRITLNTRSALSVPFDDIPEYDEARFIIEGIPASTQYDLDARIQIEEGASFTTFAPYSNECPITGYTECVVDRDGKNLFDVNDYTLLDSGVSVSDDAIKVVAGNYRVARYNEVLNLSAGNYVLSFKSNITSGNIFTAITKGKNTIFQNVTNQSAHSITFTLSESGAYTFVIGSANLTPAEITIYDIQIETGSTATPYVPYSHYTATIAFGQTVYGGSVDFKTGVGIADKAFATFDGSSDENWDVSSDRFRCRSLPNEAIDNSTTVNGISNEYNVYSADELYGNRQTANWIGCAVSKTEFLIVDNVKFANKDLSEFKTWLASNPVQLCYKLATPITIQLTPAELELLKGYNYITTNGTTIALDYLPDSLLAEAENYVDNAVEEALDEIEDGLHWQFVDTITSSHSVTIPTSHEILFVALNDTLGTAFGSLTIPSLSLPKVISIPYYNNDDVILSRSGTTFSTAATGKVVRVYKR